MPASPSGVTMRFEGLISRWIESAGVCGGKAVEHLEEVSRSIGDAKRTAAPSLDDLVEALALDVLHDHEIDIPLTADVEGPRQVGVLDPPREIHLAAESGSDCSSASAFLGGSTLIAT